jgi:hypothetical protein
MRVRCSGVTCQMAKLAWHVIRDTGERGSSLAWVAIFLAAVVIPLLALVIDGSRLFYVRGRLQTATDAACEDAAWSGADYRVFRDTGQARFVPDMGPVIGQAQRTFSSTLGDGSSVNFTASAAIVPDFARVLVRCNASASVPLAVMLGAAVNIRAQAVSAVRFTR